MKKLIAVIAALVTMICGCVAAFAEQPVTREKAREIALNDAGLKQDQVTFTKVRMDREDGRQVWEIEFFRNNVEYEFDVDMLTGRIVESDRDRDRDDDRDDDWDDWFDFD